MPIAYVLINVQSEHKQKIYQELSKVEGIFELHPLDGEYYDLIAKIETKSFENIADIIKNKIRSIKGIIDTKTLTGTKF